MYMYSINFSIFITTLETHYGVIKWELFSAQLALCDPPITSGAEL